MLLKRVGKGLLERPKHKWDDGIKMNDKNVVATA
jgi:hypothetical protein